MNSLLFNFFKRTVLIPLAITFLAVAVTFVAMPKIVASTNVDVAIAPNQIDVAQYSLTDYNAFNELESSTYIGDITVESVNVNCAVVYDSNNEYEALNMINGSVEPWSDNSAMVVTGANTKSQLNYMHDAKVGDVINFQPYKHSKYTYQITSIDYGVVSSNFDSYMHNGQLVLCVPYTNFYNADEENFYTVYVADLVDGGVNVE